MHYLLMGLIGLLAGVLLNRVADELPAGRHPLRWPLCSACGAKSGPRNASGLLAWVLGWRGCPACGAVRGWRAAIVEGLLAIAFALLAVRFAGWQLAAMCFYVFAFLLVAVIDLEHRLIYDIVTLPAAALALAGSLAFPQVGILRSAMGAAVGYGVFLLLAWMARRKEGLGGGDVTLSGFIGAATGFPNVIVALVSGIVAGGLGAIVLLLARRAKRSSYVPYAPFLIVGALVALLVGDPIVQWYVRRMAGG